MSQAGSLLRYPAKQLASVRTENVADGPALTRGAYIGKAVEALSLRHDVRMVDAGVCAALHNENH